MARRDDDRFDIAIPEADRLEQEQQADPADGTDHQWPDTPTSDVDEADRLEQAREVLADPGEEYAPNPSEQ